MNEKELIEKFISACGEFNSNDEKKRINGVKSLEIFEKMESGLKFFVYISKYFKIKKVENEEIKNENIKFMSSLLYKKKIIKEFLELKNKAEENKIMMKLLYRNEYETVTNQIIDCFSSSQKLIWINNSEIKEETINFIQKLYQSSELKDKLLSLKILNGLFNEFSLTLRKGILKYIKKKLKNIKRY
jgi:hypothetical protein